MPLLVFIFTIIFSILAFQSKIYSNDNLPPAIIQGSHVFNIEATSIGELYTIKIFFPPEKSETTKFPVIYLTDSDSNFEIVTGIIRNLIHAKEIPPVIIVGIGYDCTIKEYEFKRKRDLTPVPFKNAGGGANNFLTFIKANLIPYIESNYPVNPQNKILVGHSFGALFGSYILFNEPELFSKYMLISPSYWWANKYLFEVEKKYNEKKQGINATMYISVGEFEKKHTMIAHYKEMVELLKTRKYSGLKWKEDFILGETHISTFPTAFSRGIRYLLNEN